MLRLEGKVALVTGAGMGIGRAVAVALAAEGARIGAMDIDWSSVSAVRAEIESAGGGALALVGDVRSAADAEHAVSETVRAFGRLDLLANIAGVLRSAQVPDCDEDTWDLVLDTNVKGMFLLCKYAIPQMRPNGGAIVNAASVLAFAAQQGVAAYCASKGAVVSLTQAMALDHASEGIRVNCVAPGSVRTPLLRSGLERGGGDPDEGMRRLALEHPMGRLVEPDEVARLVLFLLSDDASAMTGGCYRVDNGLLSKVAL